jgi:hypothetical protein
MFGFNVFFIQGETRIFWNHCNQIFIFCLRAAIGAFGWMRCISNSVKKLCELHIRPDSNVIARYFATLFVTYWNEARGKSGVTKRGSPPFDVVIVCSAKLFDEPKSVHIDFVSYRGIQGKSSSPPPSQ